MMDQTERKNKPTVVCCSRKLSESEQKTVAKVFSHTIPFIYSYHCHRTVTELVKPGELLTVDLTRKRNVEWIKEQNQSSFNMIILADKLKRKHTTIAMAALGWLTHFEETVDCAESLFAKCAPITKVCGCSCF